jgi:hypothetical protein
MQGLVLRATSIGNLMQGVSGITMVIARIRKPHPPEEKPYPIRENFLSLLLAGQGLRESVVFQPTKNSDRSHRVRLIQKSQALNY